MGFREDREAVGQRADALERELAEVRAELMRAQLKSSIELDELKKRLDGAPTPPTSDEPIWKKWGGVLSVLSLLALMGGGVYVIRLQNERERESAAQARELAQLDQRLSSLTNDVYTAETERDRAYAELETARAAEHEAELARHHAGAPHTVVVVPAQVTMADEMSPLAVRRDCTLSVASRPDGECEGDLDCGGMPTIGEDRSELFRCQMRDGVAWDPALAPAPDAVYGNGMSYDATTGRIELDMSRPPFPRWRATLTTRRPISRVLR